MMKAATPNDGGCNPSRPRLQPYVHQVRGFLVMVAAGVAGNSTHMMSSAVLALARLVYAYRGRESMLETSVRSEAVVRPSSRVVVVGHAGDPWCSCCTLPRNHQP